MADKPGIFPTYFLSGFECSNFLWSNGKRRNLVAETLHDKHVDEDYKTLQKLGIGVAREGILWPMVDKVGICDFSGIDPMIEAMNKYGITPIWELCHYGYPDDLDPFGDSFVDRFAAYCKAAAEYIVPKMPGPYFFAPINEITFFAFCGAEWGWVAPYRKTREDRLQFRLILCAAAIAAVKAIRSVAPSARFIHLDPLVNVVTPGHRPDLARASWYETYVDTYLAWDILYGKEYPELGGTPDILDIVGANNYSFGQMEYREFGPHQAIDPNDHRVLPLADLLQEVWSRYKRPMIIGETSGLDEGRPFWLRDVMTEALAAVDKGIDLQGVCLFPAVNMPDWHTGKWLKNGLSDVNLTGDDLPRQLYQPYIAELYAWQKQLNHVTMLSDDPLADPINMQDVIDAARRLHSKPDKDWH